MTLRGAYGARSTRDDKNSNLTSTLHIAAPLYSRNNKIIGVVTTYKSMKYTRMFIFNRLKQLLRVSVVVLVVAVLVVFLAANWITRPILTLTSYINRRRCGENAAFPVNIGRGEIYTLGCELEQMRI